MLEMSSIPFCHSIFSAHCRGSVSTQFQNKATCIWLIWIAHLQAFLLYILFKKYSQINFLWLISKCVAHAAVGDSDPWYWETIQNSKCSLAPFDKRLRLLAVCVIKQNGILWKPFLWCHRHLSKTLDVYEGETEFDSSDISLNHIAGYATVLPPEATMLSFPSHTSTLQ